ncbi:UvrD-helicase domain-containing protein [Chryseobacterium sp. 5_R23647]|uniref:UvrD-helicase domain-containing protein n=1 Tax=Chryseobacterium sp. 5_R23647 TaxID=2258964 RepID=UPI000E284888|nr:ATP-dependent helicase [Chryseobacterium sp. 5_R23647]REC42049.1 ATP-dependent helicase [Chryseobacterium sp. 5_R23647]
MFVWEKGSLNSEQEFAILEKDSVLLVACPGSGKTRTLTFKIAYELSRLKSNKEFVIAITYTNSASEEIKERVELLGVDTSQLWIGTIHSFCMEWILKPYHLYSDRLKNGFKVINSFDSEKILIELCEPYKDQKITHYDCGILAKTDSFYLTCLDTRKHASLKKILAKYFKVLEENHQIDFEQILFFSYKLLIKKPVIEKILCKLFPFILIDEYQDTKEIQYHIIARILSANKGDSKTLIVGDPNQSIYDSLGGYPMPQNELEKLLGFDLKPLSLHKNYRSSSSVINYFDYYKTFETSIIAFGTNKDYPSTITFNYAISVDNLIEEIARLILYNVENLGISPNEICITAPQWIHIASITRRLIVRLPDFSFDGPGMAPFSRDIENFWFKVSRIALTEPSPFMYVRRLRWSKEILNELESAGVDVSSTTTKELLKICNSFEIFETDGLDYLRVFFDKICQKFKITLHNFPMLDEHYDSFFASSEARISRLIDEGNPSIGEVENFRKVFRQRDGITVSTIHSTKGEEYDTVIGFGLVDGYVPHFNDGNGLVNSKKLLYVLASRARKNLHLISERKRNVHSYYAPDGKLPTSHLIDYDYDYSIV